MEFVVPDHIAYCFSAGRPIFLDVARNRYFTVSARLAEAFDAFVRGERAPELQDALDALAGQGLLVRSSARPTPRTPIEAARRDLTIQKEAPFRLGDGLAVTRHVWRTYRRLRHDALTLIIADLKRRRSGATTADPNRTADLHARFLRHRPYVPIKANCLLDSIALLDFLGRHGDDANLVFGVTPSPFSAHCWLQRGDQVLNDVLDRVSPRLPIMVV
ncbi:MULTISPECIES: lasso peptide biosynthesis B2 protein [unclassified Caulobacter]|jgi:hypothetical protein|uniref:lasso peptide biosynthesis B2 protein n=1 Tax=unclassified Caulobacter TaxID=2648921 RepID=UPI00070161DD|nr:MULTISPECIES: lasso peptide biosynthesis B2 protein [unclassified Caulobacter]KQV54656.1 hypothetical protein ASC62_22975 [Caulobacter sp. Root342]KQV64047.1 hypothetical protein ASC70_19655 [Caulobacter sp. Root343]